MEDDILLSHAASPEQYHGIMYEEKAPACCFTWSIQTTRSRNIFNHMVSSPDSAFGRAYEVGDPSIAFLAGWLEDCSMEAILSCLPEID